MDYPMDSSFILLVLLVAGHFIFDYPLQGDWLSKAKNPHMTLVPGEKIWPLALAGHAVMHAACVMVVLLLWPGLSTDIALTFFFVEFVVHFFVDYMKCKGYFGYNTDQLIHLATKFVLWLSVVFNVYAYI